MPFVKPTIEKRTKSEFPNAYWDFLGFGVEKNSKLVYIVFGGWASKEAHDAGAGARAFVTDANATTFLSTVAGGGSNKVPVVSDGTNWLIG